MDKCPKCGETENFHYNYDFTKANSPIIDILCNECGTYFPLNLKIPKQKVMKNVHLIPTDKPSKLYLHSNGEIQIRTELSRTDGYLGNNQHIYITSSEKIKEGDWVITYNGLLAKVITEITWHFMNSKKVILTTDQELIKDGVRAIDNEFLEWFVKNPSCEEVEVMTDAFTVKEMSMLPIGTRNFKYKIIIPKEEPKQDYSGVHLRHCYQGEYEDGCKYGEDDCPAKPLEPKQETLEEAAEKYVEDFDLSFYDTVEEIPVKELGKKDFKEGAKWQQERMYSEEDMREAFRQGMENMDYSEIYGWSSKLTEQQWFENFKKTI